MTEKEKSGNGAWLSQIAKRISTLGEELLTISSELSRMSQPEEAALKIERGEEVLRPPAQLYHKPNLAIMALILEGGEARSRAWSGRFSKLGKDFGIQLPSDPSKIFDELRKQQLIERTGDARNKNNKIVDWLRCLSRVKSEPSLYRYLTEKIEGSIISKFILSYLDANKGSFHIVNEFYRDCVNIGGEDLGRRIKELAPDALVKLQREGVVELIEDMESAFEWERKTVARVIKVKGGGK